ncbi:MAG: serine/threonine-protein kinase [Polyangiales bacterium]
MSEDPQSQSDPWIGATVAGRYHVVRRIGVGGHGAVYEVEHAWTRRRVAMKMLRSDRTHVAGLVERFLREAQAATQVKHPNIVDVFDMGQDGDGGALYIVEELLLGDDLRHVLKQRKKLPYAEAMSILGPVMSALEAAHRAGVVHRDVKPGNIFLSRGADGVMVPKLIDFGTSRVAEDPADTSHLTMTGEPIGTPAYMSPEQVRGVRAGAEVDVWAMGVVLYETLSGVRPFVAPNYGALVLRIATEDPQRLDVVAPEVSRAIADVVHRALSRRIEDRPPSMGAFLEALRSAERGPHLSPLDFDPSEERTVETRLPVSEFLPVRPDRVSRVDDLNKTVLDPPRHVESLPPEIASTPVEWTASTPDEPPPPSRKGVFIAGLAALSLVAVVIVVAITRATPTVTHTAAHAPASAPVAQPIAAPVAQPVAAPVAQPVAAPVAQPVAAPVAQPIAAPVAQPIAAPVQQPVAAPVAQPVAAPVQQPVEQPVEQPVAAPAARPRGRVVTTPRVRGDTRVRPHTTVNATTIEAPPQRVAPRGEYEIP